MTKEVKEMARAQFRLVNSYIEMHGERSVQAQTAIGVLHFGLDAANVSKEDREALLKEIEAEAKK